MSGGYKLINEGNYMKRTRINLADKSKKTLFRRFISNIAKHPLLYIMALPVILYYLVYHYYPMYGMLIAFLIMLL